MENRDSDIPNTLCSIVAFRDRTANLGRNKMFRRFDKSKEPSFPSCSKNRVSSCPLRQSDKPMRYLAVLCSGGTQTTFLFSVRCIFLSPKRVFRVGMKRWLHFRIAPAYIGSARRIARLFYPLRQFIATFFFLSFGFEFLSLFCSLSRIRSQVFSLFV